MKILQLTSGYFPTVGGVERHVQGIAEHLAARGHEVTVGTMQPRARRLADEVRAGVRIRRFTAAGLSEAYRVPLPLLGFLCATRNQWDVVHVHNYHAALIPLVALAGVRPFVVTTHLNDTPHSTAARLLHVPYSAVGRWAVRQAPAVICVTEAERERVRQRLGVDPRRSVVIPNGVSEGVVTAGNVPGQHDPYLLLSVGRLHAYKRVEDALAILAELNAPYRLVVVGDGPHRGLLERRAEALGVRDRVDFVGQARDEELTGWYRRAGIVLSLSEAEAFGMTLLEGVAAGCQVVCSDIPAYRDLARSFPEEIGVVARGNLPAGAAAVRAAGVRVAGPRVAPPDISQFTWAAVTERVLDVYRRVTGVVEAGADAEGQHLIEADGGHPLDAGGDNPPGADEQQLADADRHHVLVKG